MKAIPFSFAVLILAGCATIPKDAGFKNVQATVQQRIGQSIEWRGNTTDGKVIDAAVHSLLAGDLTADQAVRIALLNNRNLQATYEELGISQADVVQAGLLKNPIIDLSVRFPDRSPGKTYLDFSVAEDFIDLLLLPARQKMAEAQFKATQLRVTHEALQLAADVKSAFYSYQSAEQTLELHRTAAAAMAAAFEAAKRLHDAGNINDLDYTSQHAQSLRAQIDLADATAESMDLRERLNVLMGLGEQELTWTAQPHLPDLPSQEIGRDGLENLAINQRLDLAAARQDLLTRANGLGITNTSRLLSDASLGVEAERETDGQWKIGPTLSLPLPLFDQGQATVARAQAQLRQSQDRYAAMIIQIRSQVRAARSRMFNARTKAELYQSQVVPLSQQQLEQTQLQYNGMLTSVFQLLQARRDQIDAGRQYIESLRDYWTARAELERVLGGQLPSISQPSSQPAQGDLP